MLLTTLPGVQPNTLFSYMFVIQSLDFVVQIHAEDAYLSASEAAIESAYRFWQAIIQGNRALFEIVRDNIYVLEGFPVQAFEDGLVSASPSPSIPAQGPRPYAVTSEVVFPLARATVTQSLGEAPVTFDQCQSFQGRPVHNSPDDEVLHFVATTNGGTGRSRASRFRAILEFLKALARAVKDLVIQALKELAAPFKFSGLNVFIGK
ncbi:hypothetical protein BGZ83_003037 [Gryganskiella cystojenkinii]|nr:hypothetical protein BGZ83_003037 [Gryganskiella cystojenkinii]